MLLIRVTSKTSFVSYFAKHKMKQVLCFVKQTCCFAKFHFEAKLAILHVSLFFKLNETACCGLVAAGSGKSTDPILHQEPPHIKNHSDAMGDFKN
jgi:hypothetical protein